MYTPAMPWNSTNSSRQQTLHRLNGREKSLPFLFVWKEGPRGRRGSGAVLGIRESAGEWAGLSGADARLAVIEDSRIARNHRTGQHQHSDQSGEFHTTPT